MIVSRHFTQAKQKYGGMSRMMPIVAAWLSVCFIWGSTWVSLKIALEDLPPFSLAAIRTLIAASVLTLIIALLRVPLPRDRCDWLLMAKSGLLMISVNYALLAWGAQHVSAGLGAIVNTTMLIFGFLLAHLHLPDERLTLAKFVGIALGIFGVALIFFNQINADSPLAIWGGAAILTCAFCVAYSNVIVKSRGDHLDRLTLTAGQMWFGIIPLFLVGLIAEGNPLNFRWTANAVYALFYLALIGSTVAFVVYYWLVKQIDVTKTMLIMLVTPLVAVALGIWLLDENLTWRIVLGGICIFAGVGLILTRHKKMKIKTPMTMEKPLQPN